MPHDLGHAPDARDLAVDVLLVGSANMDMTLRMTALPGAGETAPAGDRGRRPGGRGATGAVAAAAAGARVSMVGCVGAEGDGDLVGAALERAGVGTAGVRVGE